MTPEFSRLVDIRHLPERPIAIAADAAERAALAERFAIEAIDRLEAEVALDREGGIVLATGRFEADIVQVCAVAGEPFPTRIADDLALRIVQGPAAHRPDEEIELDAEDCDEIAVAGPHFDLGEAVAQSLALAIDPYATGPDAERVRREAGLSDEAASGPFAVLSGLVKR